MKTQISPHHPSSPASSTSLISNPGAKNFAYPGAKAQAGVFHTIIGQMPPHHAYVENFFGDGQIFKRKRRAEVSYLYDINPGVIGRIPEETGVHARVADGYKVLKEFAPSLPLDTVIYCDPPYLLETRGSAANGRNDGEISQCRLYYKEFELAAERKIAEDRKRHTALLTLLQALRCRVLLSGYPSELYSSQLKSWRCIEYPTRTRRGTVTECLWCNFPEPEQLHDWNFAGQDYRERDDMKRQAHRWLRKLESMRPRHRGYLLHLISQRHFHREDPESAKLPLVDQRRVA